MTVTSDNMLKPNKHLDLDRCVLRVSALILAELRRRRMIQLDSIRALILRRVGDDADVVLVPALNLLYLVGKLDYHVKNDAFEYIDIEAR